MDMDINTQLLFSTSSRRSKNDGIIRFVIMMTVSF